MPNGHVLWRFLDLPWDQPAALFRTIQDILSSTHPQRSAMSVMHALLCSSLTAAMPLLFFSPLLFRHFICRLYICSPLTLLPLSPSLSFIILRPLILHVRSVTGRAASATRRSRRSPLTVLLPPLPSFTLPPCLFGLRLREPLLLVTSKFFNVRHLKRACGADQTHTWR